MFSLYTHLLYLYKNCAKNFIKTQDLTYRKRKITINLIFIEIIYQQFSIKSK